MGFFVGCRGIFLVFIFVGFFFNCSILLMQKLDREIYFFLPNLDLTGLAI